MNMLDHTILWHIYPLSATGADIRTTRSPGRGLASLNEWLDYVVELGCNGLLLGPIFASVSHGYDTLDHYRIDDRLGTDADFDALIAACRDKGISVYLDGVFNHVAREHHAVEKGLTTGQGWEGHDELVELDHANPVVADEVVAIMEYWLAKGIAGWRLDVAYSVPAEFWATVTERVRRTYPNAVFLGEIIHGDYGQLIREGNLDMTTQYELWKALWSSLKDVNFHELSHALGRHNDFLDAGRMQTFIGNHDTDRIASTVGTAGAALAAGMLLTLPGVPSIYYGDEQGFQGERGEGAAADDPVRPPLPATPAELSPLGGWMYELCRDLIAFRRRHPFLVDSRVEVSDVSNDAITYRAAAGEEWVEVRISYDGSSASLVAVASDGEELERKF